MKFSLSYVSPAEFKTAPLWCGNWYLGGVTGLQFGFVRVLGVEVCWWAV